MSDLSYDSEKELLVVSEVVGPSTVVNSYPRAELVRMIGACEATVVNATAERKVWEERLAEFDKQAELNPKPVDEPVAEPV